MSYRARIMTFCVLFSVPLVQMGCAPTSRRAEMLKVYKYTTQSAMTFADDQFRVKISRLQCAVGATNYLVELTIENVSDEPRVFDVSEFELVDESTGITYPLVKTDNVMSAGWGILQSTELKPARKLQGRVYFQTAQGKARAQSLSLFYRGTKIEFQRAGFFTDEELKNMSIFADENT